MVDQFPVSRRFRDFAAGAAALGGRTALWRVPFCLVAVVAGQILATIVIFGLYDGFSRQAIAATAGPLTPDRVILFLLTFIGPILFLLLSVRLLHGLGPRDLLGPARRFPAGQALAGFGIVAVVAGCGVGISMLVEPLVPNLPFGRWVLFAAPALGVLVIQVLAEELVFRGYLQGRLAARFSLPAVWLLVPAALFGVLHWQPSTFGANAWIVVLAASLMGLITGHVTARTGSIAAAFGLHLANNVTGLLVVATPGELASLSLWLHPIDLSNIPEARAALLGNVATIAVAYGIWLVVLRVRDARLH